MKVKFYCDGVYAMTDEIDVEAFKDCEVYRKPNEPREFRYSMTGGYTITMIEEK